MRHDDHEHTFLIDFYDCRRLNDNRATDDHDDANDVYDPGTDHYYAVVYDDEYRGADYHNDR